MYCFSSGVYLAQRIGEFSVPLVLLAMSRSWLGDKAEHLQGSGTSTESSQHFLYNLLRHSELASNMNQVCVASIASAWKTFDVCRFEQRPHWSIRCRHKYL